METIIKISLFFSLVAGVSQVQDVKPELKNSTQAQIIQAEPVKPIEVVPQAPTVVEPQTPEAYAEQKVTERWGAEHWDSFNKLVHKESGYRVDAENPSSGAYGIPQCLPVSKCIAEYPDFKTNPISQINWMLDYVADRYGNPINALNFHLSHNWY